MGIFDWNDKYEGPVAEINEQHQELFRIAREIEDIPLSGNQDEWIKESVHALYRYMKLHFETEEAILEKMEYPHLVEHKHHHKDIVQEMTLVLKTSSSMKQLHLRLDRLMHKWVIEHILNEDRKYYSFLKFYE